MRTYNIKTDVLNQGKKIKLTVDFLEDDKTFFEVFISKEKTADAKTQFNLAGERQELLKAIQGFINDFVANGLGKALKHYNLKYFEFGKDVKFKRYTLYFTDFSFNFTCDYICGNIKHYIEIPYSQNQGEYQIIIDIPKLLILNDPNADSLYENWKSKTVQQVLLEYKEFEYETTQISKYSLLYNYDRESLSATDNISICLLPEAYKQINTVSYLIQYNVIHNNPLIVIEEADFDRALMFSAKLVKNHIRLEIKNIINGKAQF